MSDLFDDLIGKPFEHGATGPNSYDCYGLGQEIYKRLGKDIRGLFGYQDTDESLAESFQEGLQKWMVKIEYPEPYCIVAFYTHPRYVTHMGIVLPNCLDFIHVLKNKSVVITPLRHLLWSRKIAGYYKYGK